MDSITLKRGSGTIQLLKSENLIALKPASTTTISKALGLHSKELRPTDTGISLGGFRIVNIDSPLEKMEQSLNLLRQNKLVIQKSHVYHTPGSSVPIVPTGKITLRFKASATPQDQQNILENHNLEIIEARTRTNHDATTTETYIVRVTTDSLKTLEVALNLQQEEAVLIADPDLATKGKLASFRLPSDTLLKEQWHLKNTGAQFGTSIGLKVGADAHVIPAWIRIQSLGSPSCVVAIIDDGFDLKHPDLSGNTKIVAPWDFTTNTKDPSPKVFHPDETIGEYHGTSCAGVAVGNANGIGVVGAAPDCRFMPIRWGEDIADEDIERWFDYVAKHGAWIVSCSWGASAENYVLSILQSEAIEKCAVEGRNGLGCVILFAAGNENSDINNPLGGTVNGFAIHPNVIGVAACNSRDNRSDYSNFGKEISICAPSSGRGGRGILTSDVRGQYQYLGKTYEAGYEAGDYTKTFGGTSSATPLVAGICALILSVNPSLTSNEVKKILERTARPIGNSSDYNNGHSTFYGYGCVDADAAVKEAMKQSAGPLKQRMQPKIKTEPDAEPLSLYQREWWGISRHELIGGAADQQLNARAKSAVEKLLKKVSQSTLEQIASWADQIKGGADSGADTDTKEFLKAFPNNSHKPWHFVNFPIGANAYDPSDIIFSRENDVVQQTILCISILKGQSKVMSQLNALRWLTHLVGDIHQPIHVGCSYIDKSSNLAKLVFDPKTIKEKNLEHDQGGNKIVLPLSGDITLHSYWDSRIPVGTSSFSEFIEKAKEDFIYKLLKLRINAASSLHSEIYYDLPPERWPEQWATESIIAARGAYESLQITDNLEQGGKYRVSWEGKSAYDARCSPIVSRQLKLASERLASVLNTIFQ